MEPDVFDAMSQEEQDFWKRLDVLAKAVIVEKDAAGEERPFTPPQDLVQMHQEALDKYDGGKYCHVRRLEQIFKF
ncbi:MAG: hypothetical protein Q8Q48_02360 [Candidatus Staskawiczbacteria bacterium]|nr:hypothetical protein [Candidatus Staskawiczbacteria bacterium]